MSQNNIYYIHTMIFLKDIRYFGKLKKKCGHREKSCELKQLLFIRVYLSEDLIQDFRRRRFLLNK